MKSNGEKYDRFPYMLTQVFCPAQVLIPASFVQSVKQQNGLVGFAGAARNKNRISEFQIFRNDDVVAVNGSFFVSGIKTVAFEREILYINFCLRKAYIPSGCKNGIKYGKTVGILHTCFFIELNAK